MTSNLPHASNTRHPSSFPPSPIKTLLPHSHPFPRPLFTSLIAYQTPSAHFRSGAVAYHPFRYPLFTSYSGESHCPYLCIIHILIFSFLSLYCLLKMASSPTSPNHSSSSSESDPDATAAGGLRLEVPEIPPYRLKTYATLPLPVQIAPTHEAIDQPSIFQNSDLIVQFVNSLGGLSHDDEFNAKLRIWICSPEDRPWLHKPDGDVKRSHFFFAYEYMFSELGIRLPFSPFVQTVLRDINAAPCQLHPNAWAFIRCFEILSAAVGIAPSPTSFFYLYDVDPKSIKNKGWISLKARAGRKCLHPHKSNAKSSFARKYFRVAVHPASNPGAQPTTAAAPKGKNVTEASVAAAIEPTTVPASTPATVVGSVPTDGAKCSWTEH
ncbi:uncharacterized protein LOC130711106 isoform X1 [Lotus japonicus]|uniref:uncharacterized protein LOC130711106 isoform X1 n=1 Tax=Lotus japonicus TaxID=34305 RepID=UPI0025912A78|nr:uncharacterized protein LOC130711106 isoform X1 [Lotus japonicus]XP_057416566.1 uncharacterized protein LOC130711106 isoform X1 [Lotus japonicus]XP_057416567.1 uncharacterized protein LOC130711106 isoform X1 [Lotus japonicus]